MSILTLLRPRRLLLLLLAWGLPCAALAQGSPTPPDPCWQPGFGVPEGTNGEVLAMVWVRGSLYIGGRFTAVGGVAACNVARWDGQRWNSLGTGDENGVGSPYRYFDGQRRVDHAAEVRALAVAPNGDVYVGGDFSLAGGAAARCLARWDGCRWSAVGDFLHLEDSINYQRAQQAERRWKEQHRHYSEEYRRDNQYRVESPSRPEVLALAVTVDGSLYVGGTFHYAASAYPADTTASSVARWNGRAWTVPGLGVPGTVHALAAAPDGRVYAGGDLWSGQRAEPDVRGRVACWDGTAWATIGTAHNAGPKIGHGVDGVVQALVVAPSGELYAAGGSSNYLKPGQPLSNVARWDGHAWQLLGLGPYRGFVGTVNALAVAGGRVYAAGTFQHPWPWQAGDPWRGSQVAMWDGSAWQPLDPALPTDPVLPPEQYSTVAALTVDPVGEVYVGGRLIKKNQLHAPRYLARWTTQRWDYLPQPGAQGLDGNVLALAVAASNQVYVGGSFSQAGSTSARTLACWGSHAWELPPGCRADSSERPAIVALAVATDGQLYAADMPYSYGPQVYRIARWDNCAWHPLGPGLRDRSPTDPAYVRALAADPRGGVYVAGNFSAAGDLPAANVARWNGTAWEALGSGLPGAFYVSTLAVASNGDLYAGGHISMEADKASFPMVVRWDGRTWSRVGGFADSNTRCPGAGNAGEVYALAVAPNGDLYVGGIFSAVEGVPARNLAHWDGTAWHAVGGDGSLNLGCQVHALALAPNGDLYVGGEFENGPSGWARNLARWDGRAWHALSPGLNGPVLALACAPGNRLVVGGSFTTLGDNTTAASHFVVLDPAACPPTGCPRRLLRKRRSATPTGSLRGAAGPGVP